MLKIFSGFNRFYKSVNNNTKNKNKRNFIIKTKRKLETFKWITKSIALQFFSKTKEFKSFRDWKLYCEKLKKKKTKNLSLITIKLLDLFSKKINYQCLIKSKSISSKKSYQSRQKVRMFQKAKKKKIK